MSRISAILEMIMKEMSRLWHLHKKQNKTRQYATMKWRFSLQGQRFKEKDVLKFANEWEVSFLLSLPM